MKRLVFVSLVITLLIGSSFFVFNQSPPTVQSTVELGTESIPKASYNFQSILNHDVSISEIQQSKFEEAISKLTLASGMSQIIESKTELELYLKAYPKLIPQIPELVRSSSLAPRNTLALIHSLGLVGGIQAEEALIDLFADSMLPNELRIQAIVSSSELENPSDQILASIWNLSENTDSDIATTALLNLGVIVSSFETQHPDRYQSLLNQLLISFQEAVASESPKLSILMEALGNTGSTEIVPYVSEYLSSNSPEERSQAVFALRRVKGEEIDSLLLNLAADDDSSTVRRTAIEAMQNRNASKFTTTEVAEYLFDEPSAAVRTEMIRYLGEHLKQFPEARATIQKLVSIESDSSNYELALHYLHL